MLSLLCIPSHYTGFGESIERRWINAAGNMMSFLDGLDLKSRFLGTLLLFIAVDVVGPLPEIESDR